MGALWAAGDVAEAFGWRSLNTARAKLKTWRDAGKVHVVGREWLTGANLYDPTEVRAARDSDHSRQ